VDHGRNMQKYLMRIDNRTARGTAVLLIPGGALRIVTFLDLSALLTLSREYSMKLLMIREL
jgi:hypothetical protein